MQKHYGAVDKFIHWLMAINITATLVFSYGMSSLSQAEKQVEYGDHGLSVTTILVCLVFRIIWRITHGFAELPRSMTALQSLLARLAHYVIYLLLIAQVLTGIALASTTSTDFVASGYGINYTQFDLLPDSYHDLLLSTHIFLYWAIATVLILHVLAALKHHFVDRDEVLKSMLPGRKAS